MRTAIPILLLLCAGAALWMAFDPDEAGVGSERETPETEDTQANAPLLEGAKRTPLREETAAPVDTAPVPHEDSAPRYLVRGHVEGLEPGQSVAAHVLIRKIARGNWEPDADGGVPGSVRTDSTFEVDVTSLVGGSTPVGELDVQVDHPSHAPARTRFEADAGSTPRTWDVVVKVTAAAVATGTVVDERGGPIPGATVAAYEMEGAQLRMGGVLPIPALHEVQTDAEGKYRLRLEGSGTHVIAAREGDRLPAEGTVELKLTARRGGRLRIAARSQEGTLLDAACTITNSDGEQLTLNFNSQRGNVMMSRGGKLGTLSPSTTEPAMPPGPYVVTCTHAGVTKTKSAVVKRGVTTNIDFDLFE